MRRFFAILLLIGGGIGAYFSIDGILWQDQAIRSFVPVPAQILHSRLAIHRGSKSTTYSPDILYRYTYQARTYDATHVAPYDQSGPRSWSQDVVNRYRPGPAGGPESPGPMAFINPANPAQSFLVKEHSSTPYIFALFMLFAAEIGLGLFTGRIAGARSSMQALALDDSGWQLLLPNESIRGRFLDALAWFAGVFLTFSLVLGHFVWVTERGDGASLWFIAIGAAATLVFAIIAIRRWSITRRMSDARLRVKPVPMRFGEVFALQVEADAYAPLQVNTMRAHIVCIEHYKEKRGNKTNYGTRTRGEKIADLLAHTSVPAGQMLEGKGEVFFEPSGWPASWDGAVKIYPFYTWEIRLKVELRGAVDYSAVFPLVAA